MPTFDQRPGKNGKPVYRARVRLKGYPTQTATFYRLFEARKWAKLTESAILEGRHFKTTEAKRHTVADMIDRYVCEVLPHKRPSTVYGQTYQLRWWKAQLGQELLADITPPILVEYRNQLALK